MSDSPHSHRRRRPFLQALLSALAMGLIAAGCVERELIATSQPPGALVSLNNEEISRTPLGREFQWYGYYDASVRLEGYETRKTVTPVVAPPWLWFPFDFVAEIIPITIRDVHRVHYTLQPTSYEEVAPVALIDRARSLQGRLESGELTRVKPLTTRPANKPTSQPAE